MKKELCYLAAAFFLVLIYPSCKKDNKTNEVPVVPYTPTPYQLKVPAGFPQPVLPDFNPLTEEGVRLGRMLFYDSIVSSNGLRCASCHDAQKAFSKGIFVLGGENISVPPLENLAWNPDFEWFGQVNALDHVPIGDFTPDFFNPNMDTLVRRIKNHPQYPTLFYQAFNVSDVGAITHDELKYKISYAIIQFVRTLISSNSKYDRFVKHQVILTPEEMDGYITYYTEKGDCFHCHGSILLTSNTYNNTGLDTVFTGQNQGRYLVTGNPNDIGRFSAPSLRNIELTAPYMHDGRFQTLDDVVEFYNSGVHLNSLNIDPLMTKPAKLNGLQLTVQDKANLIAFLKTLTDTSFINNPDFLPPH
ncbi:MAG: cytochrome-c peroxidase [Bacteroidetes bacterium]|nr:cytochrome-c peroxidase [Bacteroidota bacterium]